MSNGCNKVFKDIHLSRLSSEEMILGWLDGALDRGWLSDSLKSLRELMQRLKDRDTAQNAHERCTYIPLLKHQARNRLKPGSEKIVVKESLSMYYYEEDAFSKFAEEVGSAEVDGKSDTKCDHTLSAFLNDDRSKNISIKELFRLMVKFKFECCYLKCESRVLFPRICTYTRGGVFESFISRLSSVSFSKQRSTSRNVFMVAKLRSIHFHLCGQVIHVNLEIS